LIYGVMIISPEESKRYLSFTLERATRWADKMYVGLEPGCTDEDMAIVKSWADAYSDLRCSMSENDSMAKNQAWLDASHLLQIQEDDHVVVIKATETIQDPAALRKAVKEKPELAHQCKLYHLWDEHHVRIDGDWAPKLETFVVPWRRGASYPDYRLRSGRLPSYHFNVPLKALPVSDVVDYDMVSFQDKIRKWEWFERVDAQGFYSYDHINSIRRVPTLRTWKKGGIIAQEQSSV